MTPDKIRAALEETGDKCKCTPCPECNGDGHVYFSFSGKYLGPRRCDDLDQLESCETCGGTGTERDCDYCIEQYEDDQ